MKKNEMKKILTPLVLLCVVASAAIAQPTTGYIFQETAPGTWDLLVDVTGAETAGLASYDVWVNGVTAGVTSFTQNTLDTGSTGFMSTTVVQGDFAGDTFNAANYQVATSAISGIGKTAVSDGPVILDARALLGTFTTPAYLGAGNFSATTPGLLNAAGDGYYGAAVTPTIQVIPGTPTVKYTFQETTPGSWNVLADVTGGYTNGLASYDVWVNNVAAGTTSFTQNTLDTGSTGFMSTTVVQGDFAGDTFNAANYQVATAAVSGIGMTAVSDGPVSLNAQALLGTLSTPLGLGDGDFSATTPGLLHYTGTGYYDAAVTPTIEVIPEIPTVHYTFEETAAGTWEVSIDVAGGYTAGLSAYEFYVDGVDEADITYTENTLAVPGTRGFINPVTSGNVGPDFNVGNYQNAGSAILGIGKVAVSDPPVSLDAHALLGTLTTTLDLVETDFRVVTGGTGLFNLAGDGFYDTTGITPTITVIGLELLLAGDANRDGVVSAGDYASVQSNFGNSGLAGIPGDANGDGVVSAGDYASVQANFGNTAPPVEAVPEPATMSLLVLGGVALIRRKRK